MNPYGTAIERDTYDAYGNATKVAAAVSDGSSRTTINTYTNDTTNWFLGRLITSNVQSIVGSSNLTRHSSFGYDPASGLVTQQIVEPNDTTGLLKLETDYIYDAYGNKHIATTTGLAATPAGLASQSRATTSTYDSNGRFATTVANALGESEQWSYSPGFGAPLSHTGPNGLTTSWTLDSFGRPTKEVRPDGTRTTYAYLYCSGVNGGTASCPVNGAYLVESFPLAPDGVTQAGPDGIAYYDALGRAIASDTQAFDASQWIRSETLYDSFGRVAQTSRPFFLTGGTPALSVNAYLDPNGNNDPSGRAWSVTAPDASVTLLAYHGLTTTVTNARGAVTTTLKNAQGLIASVTDAVGQATSYAYDAFGDVKPRFVVRQ
jgi:YD repeat-containing protein